MPYHYSFQTNLRWAFGWTLAMATMFSVLALFILGVQGGSSGTSERSVWVVIGVYYGIAVLAGVILAICRPLTGSRSGSFILGMIIGFLAYASFGVLLSGVNVKGSTFIFAAILSLATGGLGVVFHDDR